MLKGVLPESVIVEYQATHVGGAAMTDCQIDSARPILVTTHRSQNADLPVSVLAALAFVRPKRTQTGARRSDRGTASAADWVTA
jgi:hypothetical protein